MCEYDYDWIQLGCLTVTTRKAHTCDSCHREWPKGTRMVVSTGKSEGVIVRSRCCPVCNFALDQEDHTALHLCWGWANENGYTSEAVQEECLWDYLKWCHDNNETPTVTHWQMIAKQHLDAEDAA